MDLRLLLIVGFLSALFLVVTCGATLTPEEYYWQSMLPNTPMPKLIRDHLPSDSEQNTGVNVGRKSVSTVRPEGVHIAWSEAASADQLRDDPNASLFFLEKDLVPAPGTTATMNIQFTKPVNKATFLPREEVEAIPFSSNKFSNILQRFSIVPGSDEAQSMKETIQDCEREEIPGEDKYCATSLESMVDFSTSRLGTNVQVMSQEVNKEGTQKQEYTINTQGVKKMASDKAVLCHAEPYVYAVFYCHAPTTTRVYTVPLVAADGTKTNAISVCHTDTANWNPNHLAFQVLKVKPGATVCHFLTEEQVVWVQN